METCQQMANGAFSYSGYVTNVAAHNRSVWTGPDRAGPWCGGLMVGQALDKGAPW